MFVTFDVNIYVSYLFFLLFVKGANAQENLPFFFVNSYLDEITFVKVQFSNQRYKCKARQVFFFWKDLRKNIEIDYAREQILKF